MQSQKKEFWYYIVRVVFSDGDKEEIHNYKHSDKNVALARAKAYIKISIRNVCINYAMGKLTSNMLKISYELVYRDSPDEGKTFTESLLQVENVRDHLGNYAV